MDKNYEIVWRMFEQTQENQWQTNEPVGKPPLYKQPKKHRGKPTKNIWTPKTNYGTLTNNYGKPTKHNGKP